jgi:hypothetical protein
MEDIESLEGVMRLVQCAQKKAAVVKSSTNFTAVLVHSLVQTEMSPLPGPDEVFDMCTPRSAS